MTDNFQWISNDSASHDAYITLDAMKRLYLSTKACAVMGLPKKEAFELFVGYDALNKRLVIAKPDLVSPVNVKPFKFDKRSYASARPLLDKMDVKVAQLPLRYNYVGRLHNDKMYPAGTYVFELDGHTAVDGRL
ncbi:hypothetical protein AB1282_00360 [Gottfriedia sp. S16(2024)]|uniref:hypothetical protein n=1 Tax=Gottfriedia sp. S16(2024) TaxID=3162883 RepID=UPI003D1E8712